jgi:hypothetical protein
MERTVNVWSKAYAPTADTDHYSIQVDQELWEEIIREEMGRRVFLQIQHPGTHANWIAPMGQPVPRENHGEETVNPNIYLPLWMVDAAHLDAIGEPLQVTFLSEEAFPEASRLVFQVVDSAFYNSDVKEELERALTSLGVLRRETTLQIPIDALGGYAVEVFVAETEPSEIVLCDGEEVAVEFREPVDQFMPPPPRPPTPIPQLPEILEQPPLPIPPIRGASLHQPPVFPGEGRTIGSDPTIAPPPWRQGIPIRRPPVVP